MSCAHVTVSQDSFVGWRGKMALLRLEWFLFGLVIYFRSVRGTEFPCTVAEDTNSYDLSELGTKDYWEVTEVLHTGLDHKKLIYISLCHPLKNVPAHCEGNSTGVCVRRELGEGEGEVTIGNAGQVPTTGPKVAQSGWIEYIFYNGEACTKRGNNETYKTFLNIKCARNEAEETPGPILITDAGCHIVLAWMTKAGCPKVKDNVAPNTCLAKFPNSDHTLNLHSLHASNFYKVQTHDLDYEVNICGAIINGTCEEMNTTVCQVGNGGTDPVTLTTTSDMSLEWRDSILFLTYKTLSSMVDIQFHCDRQATETIIYRVENNSTYTGFTLRTSAVCTPEALECVLRDSYGNIYDLRSLWKTTGNWEALPIIPTTNEDILYHINVCGQVNSNTYHQCPSGPIGACQTDFVKNTSYNLGFLTTDPVVNEDKSVTILYTGGDACKEGKHSRSTRISLVCSETEHGPMFIKETATCDYVFKWLTPAACPRHVTTGSDCQVKDPLYGNIYDLRPLRNSAADYKVTGSFDQKQYLINLCGPLLNPCGGEEEAGLCQVDGPQKISGGLASSNLTFRDGSLSVKYENGTKNCQGGSARSSTIIFLCNHDESGRDGPLMLPGDECVFNFVWQTIHACPPFHVVDCSYSTADGRVYDLKSLSSPHTNKEYYLPHANKKIVLNVCRSVVHSKVSRCSYTAGACIVDLDGKNGSVNIGEVHSGPYLDDDVLKLKYMHGSMCNDTHTYETIITFLCNKDSNNDHPHFITEENCTYFLEWETPAACPEVASETTSSIPSGENCRVNSTHTGYVFDLNILKHDTGYEVHDDDDLHLNLNVCGEVDKTKCPWEGSGACSYTGTHDEPSIVVNAGKANAKLHYTPGFLFLYYTGGDKCNSTARRSTFISFICGAENVNEGPVLIHDDLDKCTYFVNWYTSAACERRIDCFVDTRTSRLDLSPLIRSTGNYEIINPSKHKEKFYLNVCRPLNPITGFHCQPGSAACLYNSSSAVGPINLGHPAVSLVYVYEEGVKMMYTHGSKCPTNPSFDISSMISFICNESAEKGNPIFKEVTHDCQYQFEWETSHVCEHAEEPDIGPICQIRYDDAKANVDLTPLQRPEGYNVSFGGKEYKINVCGPACDQSGVCTSDGSSYGLVNKSELAWDYKFLKLTYYNGDACSSALSGHKTTSIYFECDMSAGYGKPVADELMYDIHCIALFVWKTNITCLESIYGNGDSSATTEQASTGNGKEEAGGDLAPGKQTPDKDEDTSSTVTTVVASVIVVCGLIFVAVLILFKSVRGQRVVAAARRIIRVRGYINVGQTRTESSGLLGTTTSARIYRVDDSDDEPLRV